MDGYVPAALVALTLADAEQLCDRLNRRLGLDREAWSKLVARSMSAGRGDAPLHRRPPPDAAKPPLKTGTDTLARVTPGR